MAVQKRENAENLIMKTTFSIMCRILRYVEKSLDDDVFDRENFTAERFGTSHNRFVRILDMMIQEGFITGIKVVDYGEPDSNDPFGSGEKYQRFAIKIDNPSLTVRGIRFQAENTAIMKVLQTVKGIGDIAGIVKA